MNMFSYKRKVVNLSAQIKQAIGYRVLACFLLALTALFIMTIFEVASSSRQLENNIESECETLKSFIISQIIIQNEDAIQPKLEDVNLRSNIYKFSWDTQASEPSQNELHWHLPFYWDYNYLVKNMDGSYLGTLVVTGSILDDHVLLYDLLKKISFLCVFFALITIVLYPLGNRIPQQLFITPIDNLLALLRNEKNQSISINLPNIPEEINEIKDKITTLLNDAEESSREAALRQIAMQLAHDIRSPLLVLNIETESLHSISEKKRISIRNAIQRVNDIANNLLSQNRKIINNDEPALQPEPIADLLDSIVSEKRSLVSNTPTQITLIKCPEAHSLFVSLDTVGFKRTLSNIINNSIEALSTNGLITVKVLTQGEKIIVSVTDNGCGIPKHLLPLALEEGTSFGKKQGSGLGLPYSINKIYSWKGNYSISTEINKGTTFEINLPRAKPAKWFINCLNIARNSTIIIVDDDDYIHTIWKQKFSKEFLKENNITLLNFYIPEELLNYCNTEKPIDNQTLFLLDYEFAGHTKNGLALADLIGIKENIILVTNCYEDTQIRETCIRLGIKIIPKSAVTSVHVQAVKDVDLILIDDDENITNIWKERAELKQKEILAFNDIHEFMNVFKLYDKNTLIYIDSSLGGNLKGENFAKNLHEHGYQNVFITTGYDKSAFKDMYWVKDVIDKDSPF